MFVYMSAAGVFVKTKLTGRFSPNYKSGDANVYFLAASHILMNFSFSYTSQSTPPIKVTFISLCFNLPTVATPCLDDRLMAVTSSNLNRCSKFFHRRNDL